MPTQAEYDEIETENIIFAREKKVLLDATRHAVNYINDHVSDDGGLTEGDRLETVTILQGAVERIT